LTLLRRAPHASRPAPRQARGVLRWLFARRYRAPGHGVMTALTTFKEAGRRARILFLLGSVMRRHRSAD
jgi:hypothetical protein